MLLTDHASWNSLGLTPGTRAVLERFGFDYALLRMLQHDLQSGSRGEAQNKLRGPLAPPELGDVLTLAPQGSTERRLLARQGEQLLASGEVAMIVLAGGMATRFGGGAKACAEALPAMSFLDLKLADARQTVRSLQGRIPIYLMTSFATHEAVREAVRSSAEALLPISLFPQFVSLRLSPQGGLLREQNGEPSLYAPGHGDLLPALQRAGAVAELRALGVKHVVMSNIDNLAATLDPALLAMHAATGAALTFEVVDSRAGDTRSHVQKMRRSIASTRSWPIARLACTSWDVSGRTSTTTWTSASDRRWLRMSAWWAQHVKSRWPPPPNRQSRVRSNAKHDL